MRKPETGALVSVVVPTRNSGRHLGACLASVRNQTYRPLECIVVDNHSTDATAEIAERLADKVIRAGPERSRQRNVGARASSGSFLLFVDSDMVLEPAVVGECVDIARDVGDEVAIVVPEVSFGDGFWARCKALERSCYLGDETIEAARFFSRELFFRSGGYDEAIPAGPEDWDLHERVRVTGARTAHTEAMIHHDEGRPRLRDLAAAKFYYGQSMATYIARHPDLARRQLTPIRPAFVRHRDRLAADPAAAAGMVLMKLCEFAAGGAGMAAAKLRRA